MSTAIAERPTLDPSIVQQVLLGGDLARLSPDQRVSFYSRVCESLGLNPLTQPFSYLRLNGKEVLYARKDCTEQLRFIHNISIDPKGFTREVIEGVYVVTAPASMPSGRTDVSTGAVPIDGLKGEARANAMMKAETKAKRRVTLSICGLGMLDETEVESIEHDASVTPVTVTNEQGETVNQITGEVITEDGFLRIAKVESNPTSQGKARWYLHLSDGRRACTFKQQLSSLAEQLCQEQAPVEVETKEGKWGTDLVAVRRTGNEIPSAPPAPPIEVTADDIPFAWLAPLLAPSLALLGLLA